MMHTRDARMNSAVLLELNQIDALNTGITLRRLQLEGHYIVTRARNLRRMREIYEDD